MTSLTFHKNLYSFKSKILFSGTLNYVFMRLIFKVIAKSEDDKCLQKGENTHHHKSMFSNENYRFINKNFEQSFFSF